MMRAVLILICLFSGLLSIVCGEEFPLMRCRRNYNSLICPPRNGATYKHLTGAIDTRTTVIKLLGSLDRLRLLLPLFPNLQFIHGLGVRCKDLEGDHADLTLDVKCEANPTRCTTTTYTTTKSTTATYSTSTSSSTTTTTTPSTSSTSSTKVETTSFLLHLSFPPTQTTSSASTITFFSSTIATASPTSTITTTTASPTIATTIASPTIATATSPTIATSIASPTIATATSPTIATATSPTIATTIASPTIATATSPTIATTNASPTIATATSPTIATATSPTIATATSPTIATTIASLTIATATASPTLATATASPIAISTIATATASPIAISTIATATASPTIMTTTDDAAATINTAANTPTYITASSTALPSEVDNESETDGPTGLIADAITELKDIIISVVSLLAIAIASGVAFRFRKAILRRCRRRQLSELPLRRAPVSSLRHRVTSMRPSVRPPAIPVCSRIRHPIPLAPSPMLSVSNPFASHRLSSSASSLFNSPPTPTFLPQQQPIISPAFAPESKVSDLAELALDAYLLSPPPNIDTTNSATVITTSPATPSLSPLVAKYLSPTPTTHTTPVTTSVVSNTTTVSSTEITAPVHTCKSTSPFTASLTTGTSHSTSNTIPTIAAPVHTNTSLLTASLTTVTSLSNTVPTLLASPVTISTGAVMSSQCSEALNETVDDPAQGLLSYTPEGDVSPPKQRPKRSKNAPIRLSY